MIIDSFDYFFESVESASRAWSPEGIEIFDISLPREHVIKGFEDFPIHMPSLTEPFVTTQQYLDFAELEAGDIAIDVGAYSALSSIAFSKAVGAQGRVIALEPDHINLASSQINVARHKAYHGIDNITLLNAALAGQTGELKLSAEGAMGSAITATIGAHRGTVRLIPAMTLDEVAETLQLSRVDFVKLDIEGMELEVVEQSGDFFRHFRPRVIIEPHFVDGISTAEAIVRLLSSYGYDCHVIEQIGFLHLPLVGAIPR